MLTALGLVALGLVVLAFGGDLLVRGAVAIAQLAGLTPAVIGLTVVAMGTSLPELVVSVIASLGGQPDLSIGNVVGSNICNLTLILGLTALIRPLPVRGTVVKVEWPIMLGASLVVLTWSRDNRIDRVEALVMLVLLVLVVANAIRLARTEVSGVDREQLAEEVRELAPRRPTAAAVLATTLTLAGIGLLVLGGKWLVEGAVRLAQIAGMSERVIGLTIVAVGTSAPEIATSIVAAVKGRSDIAIANLIGSNIFNLLGILGVAGMIAPLTVSAAMLRSDMWWMIATALLLFLLMRAKLAISRVDGAILLATYAAYLVLLLGGGPW
jgi:cation:H+ antiporter